MEIKTGDLRFVDEYGRTLMLRGVNLAGSSKVPYPRGATYLQEGFFDHRNVSFIGRPFPLEEAREHFQRLKTWGFTFLRFLITWEAIEHSGPGIYDEAYLEYIHEVLRIAAKYDIQVFIDPHQDVWSRFTGGDGAPGWTLEMVGFDLTRLHETGAAIVHAIHGDPFPKMIWPTNAHKLAAATMYALFFGGKDLAPLTTIEGESAQEFLQCHYIAAMRKVAHTLKDLPNIVGFDTMNEPSKGYIGVKDLHNCCGRLRFGDFPTPLQAMLLASGIPQEVHIWDIGLRGNRPIGTRLLNPRGVRLWREGFEDIWRINGVWDIDSNGKPYLLRPHHFYEKDGHIIDFNQDYYRPFANRFAREIREEMPNALIFIETEPSSPAPHWGPEDAQNIVYAPHWYDGFTLIMKQFSPWIAVDFFSEKLIFGKKAIRRSFRQQLHRYIEEAKDHLNGCPVLIGEVGIPFDLSGKRAYRTGDYSAQIQAMNRSLTAMEDNLLSYTIWNYTPDNDHVHGDQWNDEDLSIFSRDDQKNPTDIHSGGRALEAVLRPYPIATAGEPLSLSFDIRTKIFEYTFKPHPEITAPTELYVPRYQYPNGFLVEAPHGKLEILPEEQRVKVWVTHPVETYRLKIIPIR